MLNKNVGKVELHKEMKSKRNRKNVNKQIFSFSNFYLTVQNKNDKNACGV